MRISDWSSDVCPSDLIVGTLGEAEMPVHLGRALQQVGEGVPAERECRGKADRRPQRIAPADRLVERQDARLVDSPLHRLVGVGGQRDEAPGRSEEHTTELQSLMRISYAVFCLKKKQR